MYAPALVTVIELVVAPVDHNKLLPEAVNIDDPQPSVTVTTGAAGAPGSFKVADKVLDTQPLSNVIEYVPAETPVIV